MNRFTNFVRFTRPHTIVGTTISVVALYVIAVTYGNEQSTVTTAIFDSKHLVLLGLTLLSCLGSNVFIVGLNQITDIEIDRINKPYLPLASGAYSLQTAKTIIGIGVLLSLVIAAMLGKYLIATVLLSLALGIAYSLPPLRLKRFYFWAAFCIIAVRGVIVNLLLYLHFNSTLNGSDTIDVLIWVLTAIVFVYSITIAWFKDMPDVEGDRAFQIKTLSLRLGPQQVFAIGNALLGLMLAVVIIAPYLFDWGVSFVGLSSAHIMIACLLGLAGRFTDVQDSKSLFKYYQRIWLLFFLEYIVFAVLALMS